MEAATNMKIAQAISLPFPAALGILGVALPPIDEEVPDDVVTAVPEELRVAAGMASLTVEDAAQSEKVPVIE